MERETGAATDWLGTSAAARALDVSESTVRNMGRSGVLRSVRVSSGFRVYPRSAVEAVRLARRAARDAARDAKRAR